mmetsp:Transcript_36096/g.58027  ORF Transcript_36096/g.58027 Transcript_36096/m.58027 type:complete len:202 (+) Transcript_36096:342-947(+)
MAAAATVGAATVGALHWIAKVTSAPPGRSRAATAGVAAAASRCVPSPACVVWKCLGELRRRGSARWWRRRPRARGSPPPPPRGRAGCCGVRQRKAIRERRRGRRVGCEINLGSSSAWKTVGKSMAPTTTAESMVLKTWETPVAVPLYLHLRSHWIATHHRRAVTSGMRSALAHRSLHPARKLPPVWAHKTVTSVYRCVDDP